MNYLLVEGNIDVITLHQAGFDNVVATMGTALTEEHVRLLGRYTKELVLCFDNDNAGQLATQKNIELLKDSEFNVRILQLPRRLADGEYIPFACVPAVMWSMLPRSRECWLSMA